MALSHTSEDGRTYASIAGNNSVATYLATVPVALYPGVASLEIRCESGPAIAVSVGKVMTALTDGKQLAPTDDTTIRHADLGHVYIYAADTSSVIYIEARGL